MEPHSLLFVRCPKCHQLLIEYPSIPVYKCGGCGTILRAKHRAVPEARAGSESGERGSQYSLKGSPSQSSGLICSGEQRADPSVDRATDGAVSERTITSSRSGTIVSNLSSAYASSGSCLSTFSMEAAAMHFDSLGIHGDTETWWWEAAEEDRTDRIRSLVLEFFGAPSASCGIKRGDMSAVERWLKELGVGWVLRLQDGASADSGTWIRALDQITHTLCFSGPLFPDGSVHLPGICEEEGEPVAEKSVPDRYYLALFVQETMLKILSFVDVLVACWDPDTLEYSAMDQVMNTVLSSLLVVHDALSEASNKIVTLFDSPTYVEVERIQNEMVMLLSTYKSKASEVIRSTMEKIRMMLMEKGDDSPSPPDQHGGIHKDTWSVMRYIGFLINRSPFVNQVMQGHVPCTENIQPLDNKIIEMVSSLQEKLVNISESFSDQGLKLLFLLNNSYYIHWSVQFCRLPGPVSLDLYLTHKIEGYMERYLQISWAPLLSCLCNSTPLCLGKNYSLLSKFESEFQKICTTQMEWKVSVYELKSKLRQAITDKIIPGYTEYIEDNKVTHPKISPQELEAKLQELFEG